MEVILGFCDIRHIILPRPISLLLGVLYKLQEKTNSLVSKSGTIFASKSKEVVTLIGYYWHVTLAAHIIRSGTTTVDQGQVVDMVYKNKYWIFCSHFF